MRDAGDKFAWKRRRAALSGSSALATLHASETDVLRSASDYRGT